jgi:uncharacterized SAM-binding protein YcdF (DUF218 family)
MKKKFVFIALTVLVLTGTAIIFQESVLQKMGNYLVYQGPLEPAEAIIVLSGSGTGNRIKAGAMLFQRGLGRTIVISGEEIYPGYYTHTLMKNYATNIGVPEDMIITGKIEGEISTWGEGIDNLKRLKENNFTSFILVTSAFHTNRAHAVYEKLIDDLGYDFKFTVYPAKDNRNPTKDWWKTRAGKKTIFLEYLSTLNFYLEH